MRNLLFLAVFVMLAFGIFFARDRVRRACQIGAVLYGVVLAIRLLVYGFQDAGNFLDIVAVAAVFLTVWGVGWVATKAVIQYRDDVRRPPDGPPDAP